MLARLYLNHRKPICLKEEKNKQKLLSKFRNLRLKKKFAVLLNSCKRFLSVQKFFHSFPNIVIGNFKRNNQNQSNVIELLVELIHFYCVEYISFLYRKNALCNANRTHLPSSSNLSESNKDSKIEDNNIQGKNQRKIE